MTERRQHVISSKKEHQYSRPGVEVVGVGVVGGGKIRSNQQWSSGASPSLHTL